MIKDVGMPEGHSYMFDPKMGHSTTGGPRPRAVRGISSFDQKKNEKNAKIRSKPVFNARKGIKAGF